MIWWIVAYGWLILSGIMLFLVDVVSQHLRGVRTPSVETTYYYGMNTAAALGQIVFGLFGLILVLQAPHLLTRWPAITLTIVAALLWLAISMKFLPYKEPKIISAVFVVLVIVAFAFGRKLL